MMRSMSSPCLIGVSVGVSVQVQSGVVVTEHPLLAAVPRTLGHSSVESGTPSPSVSVGDVNALALVAHAIVSSSLCPGL